MTHGIRLAAKYSFMPNKLKYLDKEDADRIIFDYCCGKTRNFKMVKKLLESIDSVNLYLNLIAEKSGKKPFSRDVVEAYWIGNSLLDSISGADLRKVIKGSFKPGLAKILAGNIPDNAALHHSFHVFHINSLTKAPIFFANIDNCRIHSGKVLSVKENHAVVSYKPLVKRGEIEQKGAVEKKIGYNKKMFMPVIGDIIAVHWNLAIEKLTENQAKNLEKYTLRNIDAVNSFK